MPMSEQRLMPANPTSSTAIASDGWRLGAQAIVRLPKLFISAFFVLAFGELILRQYGYSPWHNFQTDQNFVIWTVVSQVLPTLVTAPVIIRVHQFVILKEVPNFPIWKIPNMYGIFVAWLLLADFISVLSSMVEAISVLHSSAVFVVLSFLYSIFVAYVSLRLLLIFPAIAVKSPYAGWRNAMRDSRGHVWKIFGTLTLAFLPVLLPLTVLVLVFASFTGLRTIGSNWLGAVGIV